MAGTWGTRVNCTRREVVEENGPPSISTQIGEPPVSTPVKTWMLVKGRSVVPAAGVAKSNVITSPGTSKDRPESVAT